MKQLLVAILLTPYVAFSAAYTELSTRQQAKHLIQSHSSVFDSLVLSLYLYSFMSGSHPTERGPLIEDLDQFAAMPEVQHFLARKMRGTLTQAAKSDSQVIQELEKKNSDAIERVYQQIEKRFSIHNEKQALPFVRQQLGWVNLWLDKITIWSALLNEVLPPDNKDDYTSHPVAVTLSLMLLEVGYLMDSVGLQDQEIATLLNFPLGLTAFQETRPSRKLQNVRNLQTFQGFFHGFRAQFRTDVERIRGDLNEIMHRELISSWGTYERMAKEQLPTAYNSFQFISSYQFGHATAAFVKALASSQVGVMSTTSNLIAGALAKQTAGGLIKKTMAFGLGSGKGALFGAMGGPIGWAAFLTAYCAISAAKRFTERIAEEVNFVAPELGEATKALNFWDPPLSNLLSNKKGDGQLFFESLRKRVYGGQFPHNYIEHNHRNTRTADALCKAVFENKGNLLLPNVKVDMEEEIL